MRRRGGSESVVRPRGALCVCCENTFLWDVEMVLCGCWRPSKVRSHIDMTISNLLIPPDDPRGRPFNKTRKPGPAYPPTAI